MLVLDEQEIRDTSWLVDNNHDTSLDLSKYLSRLLNGREASAFRLCVCVCNPDRRCDAIRRSILSLDMYVIICTRCVNRLHNDTRQVRGPHLWHGRGEEGSVR